MPASNGRVRQLITPHACQLKTSAWQAIRLYRLAGIQLKQEGDLPDFIAYMADGTANYEAEIRQAWEAFKLNPTKQNAREFIDFLKSLSKSMWPEVMAAILGISVNELTVDQQQVLTDALEEHHGYMEESLLPDITRAAQIGRLDQMDYRTTVLYAGALWQFGNLVTVMFDGLNLRDLADLFMFAGPNDEETCTGERGCAQYANNIYTVAQILAEGIIPGRLRCITNCRHFLLPIASPLKGAKKHLPGKHDQKLHDPHKGGATGREPWQMTLGELEAKYPKAGATVDGRLVRQHIPNQNSIDASISTPTVLDGVYEVPLSEFDLTGKHYSVEGAQRINELAGAIKESEEINPLIVVIDAEARPYILEGATRAEALHQLGAKSLPAQIVIDEGSIHDRVVQAIDAGESVPPEVLAEYDDLSSAIKHLPGQHTQADHTPKKYGKGRSPLSIPGMDEYNQLAADREWGAHPIMDDSWDVNRDIAPGVPVGERKDGKFGLCACHSLNAYKDDPSLKVMVGIEMTDDDQKRLAEFDYDRYWQPRFLGTVHVWNEDAQGRVVDHATGSRNAKAWGSVYIGKEVPKDKLDSFADDGQLLNYAHDTVIASYPVYSKTEAEHTDMWEEFKVRQERVRTKHLPDSYLAGRATMSQHLWGYYVEQATAKRAVILKHQPGRHDQQRHAGERGASGQVAKLKPQVYTSERVRELMDPDSDTNKEARKNWKNLSHAERMKLMDPKAIDKSIEANLERYREEYDIPHDLKGQELTAKSYDQVAANANAHIDSLKGALSPVTEDQLRHYVNTYTKNAVELGLEDKSLKMDAGQLDELMRKNVDKFVHQEIEARKRQLGDHGIRHTVGNIRAIDTMLNDPDLPPTTGLQRMMAIQTMVDHDIGYTVGVVAGSIPATEYHPQYSEKYTKAQGYDKLFGKGNAKEVARMVREHAETDLDWKGDTLMSTVRTADNTALFNREKLPALFYDVPGATDELYKLQLAQAGGTAKQVTPQVKKNLRKLVDDSNIDDRQKEELRLAVDEVSPYTGKFTLGMASGEIDGYDYTKDGVMNIKVYGKPERELLTGMFDLGDRQFDKFAEAYDTSGSPSTGLDFSKGGKTVLHIDYTEPSRKATGTLATMYSDSVRPDIRQASRQTGPTSTLSDRERAWPMIQANVKGKLNAAEMAEFERRFKNDTLDEMPLTGRERSYLETQLKELGWLRRIIKHLPGQHDQQDHTPKKYARGVRVGGPSQEFDYTTYWEDQDLVIVHHGTSIDKLALIEQDGLRPSTEGYTEGSVFVTTGPNQAWNYSVMGGEIEARGRARVPDEDRVVLTLAVPPSMLKPNSYWLKNRDRSADIQRELDADPGFAKHMSDGGGEFEAFQTIPPDMIVDVWQYPSTKEKHLSGQHDQQDHTPKKYARGGKYINSERSRELAEQCDSQTKDCYMNAFKAYPIEGKDARYVEGYVVDKEIGFPFQHGWLETEDELLDPTLILLDDDLAARYEYFPARSWTHDEMFAEFDVAGEAVLPLSDMRDPRQQEAFQAAMNHLGVQLKHLPGQHDQKLHTPKKYARAGADVNPLDYIDKSEYSRAKLGMTYGYKLVDGTWVEREGLASDEDMSAIIGAERDWENEVLKAIGRGDITVEKKRHRIELTGHAFNGEDVYLPEIINAAEFGPMPNELYHVTTAKTAVVDDSDGLLKSRYDLSQGRARGLGGGSDNTISYTTDKATAENIRDRMLEARKVARGDITLDDLVEQAEAGEGAQQPWMRDWVKMETGVELQPGDPIPEAWAKQGHGYEVQSYALGFKPSDIEDAASDPNNSYHRDLAPKEGYGDWEPADEGWTSGSGEQVHQRYQRTKPQAATDEWTFQTYKSWLGYRQYAGGSENPVFWGTDAEYLASIDEDEVVILKYKPKPGAVGVKKSALGEWRTWDGDALELESVE